MNVFLDVNYFLDPKEVLSLAESGDLLPDMGKTNGVVVLDSLLKINPFLKSMIVTGSPERAAAVSRMYPIIEKNQWVRRYVGELEGLRRWGFLQKQF